MTDHGVLQYKLFDKKDKDHGAISITNHCVQEYFSFLDLVISSNLQLIPIVAIDYSLCNLTFDIENKCLHTLKAGVQNDYIDALKSVCHSFQNFSQYMLGYGFGAKTIKGKGLKCDLFSLTGDFMDPIIESQE